MLSAMKGAGCHLVQIGVESGSDYILSGYSKGATTEKIREAFRVCRACDVDTLGYFMIGLPGEDRDKILSTIRFALRLDPTFASFSIATPDIGTDLWKRAREMGWIRPGIEEFDSSKDAVMDIEGLTAGQIRRYKDIANIRFYMRPAKIKKLLKKSYGNGLPDLLSRGVSLLKAVF